MTRTIAPPSFAPRLPSAFLAVLCAGSAFGWRATGVVKTPAGAVVSGVSVSVQGAATPTAVTGDDGRFDIGVTTGVASRDGGSRAWSLAVDGLELSVGTPFDGSLRLSLVDGSGRRLWSATAEAREGSAHARLPQGLAPSAGWLVVEHALGNHAQPVLVGAEGWRIASHLGALRALAENGPVLVFRKTGHADTTHSMASATEMDLSIVLRPTATTVVCPSSKLAAGDQQRSLTIGGATRKYTLHVPSSYTGTSAVPLVVDFHPIGGTSSAESGASPYKAKADAEGAVTAYPDGLQSPNMGQAWNVGPCCTTANDTAFARALVADVRKVACVEPSQVYAVGFSMGGGMTHFSACHLSDVFAAAAPAAFDLLKENVDGCKPRRPVPIIIFRSTGDGVVPYAGGFSNVVTNMSINFLGAKASFQKWAALDQCTGTPTAEDANGCSKYTSCAGGAEVVLCTKQGGGHDYGNATVGWPFLKRFKLP